jgi:hypothetical protein
MLERGLDSLFIELLGGGLLGIQCLVVLLDELLLFTWVPERKVLEKSPGKAQVNRKRKSGTLECGDLDLEGFDGSLRDSCWTKSS